jgi:hypothetical protein
MWSYCRSLSAPCKHAQPSHFLYPNGLIRFIISSPIITVSSQSFNTDCAVQYGMFRRCRARLRNFDLIEAQGPRGMD